MAPERITITENDLSETQKQAWHLLQNGRRFTPTTKLSATFRPRLRYVLHAANLKYYLGLGLKLKKVYRILTFYQSTFIKTFIDKCTELRRLATTEFEGRNIKDTANSTFG